MQIFDLDALLDSSASSAIDDGDHFQLRELASHETLSIEEILDLARQDTLIRSRLEEYRSVKLSSML